MSVLELVELLAAMAAEFVWCRSAAVWVEQILGQSRFLKTGAGEGIQNGGRWAWLYSVD
jgi:hypothetical protein